MESCVKAFLTGMGYTVNDKAQEIIRNCDDWYSNNDIKGFHDRMTVQDVKYTLHKMNFAKRCCSDDANLCEVVEINSGEKKQCDFVDSVLRRSNFNVAYRKQLEKTSASGTTACYIRLDNATIMSDNSVKGGDIRLNYVDAQCFIPLTIDNDIITEAAFSGTNLEKGKKITTLVMFTISNGMYLSDTHVFDQYGKEIPDRAVTLQLGDAKPFAVMRNAEVNNIKNMEGYGLPKIQNAIPIFMGIDLAYNILFGDLDKGEKLLLINELLCQFEKTGQPITPNDQAKKTFVLLQKDNAGAADLIHEYNPEIRIDVITKIFELLFSLASMTFGYGTKKYSFENGQITTATEYIGERQDQMQELNRQRQEAQQYIADIVKAVLWFSNTFNATSWDIEKEITVEFDDSYITDKATELDRKRNDALSFDIPELKVWYLMDAYNLTEEEATELVTGQQEQEQAEIDKSEEKED